MAASPRATSFKRYAIRAALLPIVMLVGLSGILVWQIQSLLSAAAFVEHADQVITDASRLLRRNVDMETGLRGYLLTADERFLEPFNDGKDRIGPLLTTMRKTVANSPTQLETLTAIEADTQKWEAYAQDQIDRMRMGRPSPTLDDQLRGKLVMDSIRNRFEVFVSDAEQQRADRGNAARRTAQRAAWIACASVLGVGAILAIAARRDLVALSSNYEKALGTAHELTAELERRVDQRTAELNKSNNALTEANGELGAFAYSISHDLRAPLRHIGGFADLLSRSIGPKLSPDDTENLNTIRDTAVLAGRMVDDLLAFSRIGRTDLRRESVEIADLVERCRRELEPETRGRQVQWTVGELPPAIGDAALLKLVVGNLLSNAVKYTAKRPEAKIDISAQPGEDGDAIYAVRDNGVGFDMAYAHKLFGVFQRLHRAEDYEGTGIGLANVRRIILRHGGRVWAEGRVDNGATFFFSLPGKAVNHG